MNARGRHLTHEEIEVIMARARHMRSLYVAMLVSQAALRARQWYSGAREQRVIGAQRFYPDVG